MWNCSLVNPTALWRLAGFFRTGKSERIWAIGVTLTPSAGAESITTPAYDALEVLDDPRDSRGLDRGGVLVERLYLYLKAWVCGGEHAVSLVLVVLDPVLPATGCHPEAVNQHDGVGRSPVGGVFGSHGVLLTSLSPRP
jgi:hypothetical protein